MVTVYTWRFRGKSVAWGHASMQVAQTYMSWWPEPTGRLPSKMHPQIYAAAPFRNRSFLDDKRDEEGLPDHTIKIEGLDEDSILDWWQSFGLTREGVLYQGPLQAWETLKRNCSNVVATGLKKGGGDR